MQATIRPGRPVQGASTVPGDKSIAHRWLILAATASGTSRLSNLPLSLDVRSTVECLARLSLSARPALEGWLGEVGTSTPVHGAGGPRSGDELVITGGGRADLEAPVGPLGCGNSGTTMRLLAGVVAGAPFRTVLDGDASLRARPMDRVAEPLAAMGAIVGTRGGRPPVEITGGDLHGITYELPVASAQVKSAVLLAGLAAEGATTVVERLPTRDHTERALAALGAPVRVAPGRIEVERFQHPGFAGVVPGDPSSAAFLVAAALLTGSGLVVRGVGLNPSRTAFLGVLERMGASVHLTTASSSLGEPVGTIEVAAGGSGPDGLRGTRVTAEEVPGVVDEIPVLALVAAHATGETRFEGVGELRVKESDRLGGLVQGIRSLGGDAGAREDVLVVAGGGLDGGAAGSGGDHRMAMAFAVAALAARGPSTIGGIEAADVSFPGFFDTLARLGADVELEAARGGPR